MKEIKKISVLALVLLLLGTSVPAYAFPFVDAVEPEVATPLFVPTIDPVDPIPVVVPPFVPTIDPVDPTPTFPPVDPFDPETNNKPVISFVTPAQPTVTVSLGDVYVDDGATALDPEDGLITANIVTVNNVNTSVAGTYTVTYDVSDSLGLAADQLVRTVIVVDDTTPTVSNDDDDNSSRGRSGSRRQPRSSSQGEVLGATTDDASCPFLTNYMQEGQMNSVEEVMKLQTFLNEQGFIVPVTGFFGPLTDAAVKQFQEKYRDEILEPWVELGFLGTKNATGYVFKTTLFKINDIKCPGSAEFPELP